MTRHIYIHAKGSLGNAEVVGMQLPKGSQRNFAGMARVYFQLFGKDRERPDKGDSGPEYRSVVGIPGGVHGADYPVLAALAKETGLQLLEGAGSDPDTLGKKSVYVMDSGTFPFRPAEVYHQFHDGFMVGEQYPPSYNALRDQALQQGLIQHTGCPEGFL
jgi:hypothetical protein